MDKNPERFIVRTGRSCMNRCLFCSDWPISPEGKLHFDEALSVIGSARGHDHILFSSGEPTIIGDLPERVRAARAAGCANIHIISNGRRLRNPALCLDLVSSGASDFSISIHGHTAALHDSLTDSAGSFDQTVAGIHNLSLLRRDHGFTLSLVCVLTKPNLSSLQEIIAFLNSFAPDSIIFNVPRIAGRMKDNHQILMPSLTEIADEFTTAIRMTAKANPALLSAMKISIAEIPLCLISDYEMFAGGDVVSISAAPMTQKTSRADFLTERFKPAICASCALSPRCPGIEKEYAVRYGAAELSPANCLSAFYERYMTHNPIPHCEKFASASTCENAAHILSQALSRLESAKSKSPGVIASLALDAARAAYFTHNRDDAVAFASHAAARDPLDIPARIDAARIVFSSANFARAAGLLSHTSLTGASPCAAREVSDLLFWIDWIMYITNS